MNEMIQHVVEALIVGAAIYRLEQYGEKLKATNNPESDDSVLAASEVFWSSSYAPADLGSSVSEWFDKMDQISEDQWQIDYEDSLREWQDNLPEKF